MFSTKQEENKRKNFSVRKNILIVVMSESGGGLERQALLLAKGLARSNNYNILVATREGWISRECKKNNIPFKSVERNFLKDIIFFIGILKSFSPWSSIIHTQGTLWSFVLAKILSRSKTYILLNKQLGCGNKVSYNPFHLLLFSFVDKIIGCSKFIAEEMIRVYHIPRRKVLYIWNSIEFDNYGKEKGKLRKEIGLSNEIKIVGSVARFDEEKGYDLFLDVAKQVSDKFPSVLFAVVGGGRLERYIKERTQQLGLNSKVMFLGYREDVCVLLADFDVFVLTSRAEPFGIVVLEAMASGVPVVVSNTGAFPEFVDDGENGFLCERRAQVFADRIVKILAGNIDVEGMRSRAREKAKMFDINLYIQKWDSLLYNLEARLDNR